MATVVFGDFEWDDVKAAENMRKHGVSFEEATTTFADTHALFVQDPVHADRFAVVGMSGTARLLYVIHVERGTRERIISARLATAAEEGLYSQGP